MITLLDQNTINKIAAGEVIERPSAVVKELVENAIDAGSNGITIEIKEGGISFIRITDNGSGMEQSEVPLAFKRHSTSKIKSVEDLMTVKSLGFRGEALASIASVSQVELVTKTAGSLTGVIYRLEGGEEIGMEEIGCPEGTTFIVRNLFFNTPARRKFLKSAMTEASYVGDLIEKIAISHPNITFKFISNNKVKLQTAGNHNIKDIIYHVYGRDITTQLVAIEKENPFLKVTGFIGKPIVSRGNRNYMNYFINGRYIKSSIINRAIEEAYKPYTMTHRYPFTVLSFDIDSSLIDVNVHPTKMEVRFSNQEEVFRITYDAISEGLREKELIPEVTFAEDKNCLPEQNTSKKTSVMLPIPKESIKEDQLIVQKRRQIEHGPEPFESQRILEKKKEELYPQSVEAVREVKEESLYHTGNQLDLFDSTMDNKQDTFLIKESRKEHRIIGQLFSTYWLIEFKENLFLIDQHAAHEKVLYERTMKAMKEKEFASQLLNPPIILTLSMREEEVLTKNMAVFTQLGFEVEPFGGKEYSVRAVPLSLYSIAQKELLIEMIDDLVAEDGKQHADLLLDKIASLSCKAAVKGNTRLSETEAHELIDELMTLENPYHCPHGRPTIVTMSKYEIEKKFKRII
ncbi:MAG: DNA mismatch repair endonuclease MutL [Velocimicrobium sp.]